MDIKKKINKKGVLPIPFLLIVIGIFLVLNLIGIAGFLNKLSNSPLLILIFIIILFILIRTIKK